MVEKLHPEDLEAILNAIRRIQTPWLTAAEAAQYLRCSLSRVRKLTMTREIPHEKDGSRVVYHREALDGFIRAGGARTP